MREHVVDRFAQVAVRLDLSLLELFGEPSVEFIHPGATFSLMELQPLMIRHLPAFGLGIILVDFLEDLQDIQTLLGEVRRYIDKLPAPVQQAVAHDGLEFFGHVAG